MKNTVFILFLLISITANATNYYVKSGGNDALSGLDDTNAWETLTKVNATNYSPGDTIFFKRGNTWIGQIAPLGGSAESGTEASPIVFSAYGTGAKPIITKADTLPGWSGAANWRSLTSNRYAIAFIPAVSRFLVNTGSGLTEIRKASSIQAVNATNRYYIKASVDSLYIYATSNPSAFYTNIIATYPSTTTSAPFYLFDDNWITASYLDFQGGYYSAFTARGEGIVLDSCRIGYYSAYFGVGIDGAVGNYSDNVTIKNCEINANCTFTESFSADYTEDGVNISGGADNVIIENCTVKNWWHSGIYLKNLSASYYNDSIIIRDNDVSAPDISDGRGINADTYGQNSTNVIIYRNYIHDTPVQSQINCYGVRFYYNIINNVTGCSYETGVGSGLDVNGYNTSTLPQYGKFYNNVIANCADYGILTNHYTGRPHKKGNEFINNIVINCDSAELRVYNNATDVGLYDNTYRNNLFYDASTTDVISYWNAAGVYVTTDEFNIQNGHEGDAILSNLGDDPLFTGAADFNLLTGSPAINAGIDVGLVTDYALTGVPQGIYVDIGAYEFESFPIATTGLGWEEVLSHRNFKGDVNIAAGFSVDGVPIVFSGGSPVNIPGLTASASELNILDGATVTTAEVNYSDGVTSAIQTQIDSKLAKSDSSATLGKKYATGKMLFDGLALKVNVADSTQGTGHYASWDDMTDGLALKADTADNIDIEEFLLFDASTDTLATRAYARSGGGGGLSAGEVATQINDTIVARLAAAVAGVRIADTAAMLLPYMHVHDTATMLTPYINRVDTASMLTPYINRTDTAAMLAPYFTEPEIRKADSDTIPLFVFGGGGGQAVDTVAFSTSTIYGSFYNEGSDTLVITSLRVVMLGDATDTLSVDILWDVNLDDGTPTKLNTNPFPINSFTTGDEDTSFNGNNIPPGYWVWCETPGVVLGRKPRYFIAQISGFKRNRTY